MDKIVFKDKDILYARQLNQVQDNVETAINTSLKRIYQHTLQFRITSDDQYDVFATIYTGDSFAEPFAVNGEEQSIYGQFLYDGWLTNVPIYGIVSDGSVKGSASYITGYLTGSQEFQKNYNLIYVALSDDHLTLEEQFIEIPDNPSVELKLHNDVVKVLG